jgi:hypothetical protein
MIDVLSLMREEGITLDDLAAASGFSSHSCRKYVYGEREVRSKTERELVARHGARATTIIRAMSEWRRRFGSPGSSQGVSGRVEGYYPSEPCFIGE